MDLQACTNSSPAILISIGDMLISRSLRKLHRLVARPPQEEREHHLYPYRGYGSREEIYLVGRVFRQKPTRLAGTGSLLVEIGRRLFRRGVPEAVVDARFHEGTRRVTTDRYGYFEVELRPAHPPPAERLWHEVDVELIEPHGVRTRGDVFIPPASARKKPAECRR